MHARGRVEGWWVRAFALLGFAVCAILPLGAIGTIDASFESSVAAPHSRSADRHLGDQVKPVVADRSVLRTVEVPRHAPTVLRLGAAATPTAVGLLLAALVLLALVATPPVRLDSRASVRLPRRRGPPSYR